MIPSAYFHSLQSTRSGGASLAPTPQGDAPLSDRSASFDFHMRGRYPVEDYERAAFPRRRPRLGNAITFPGWLLIVSILVAAIAGACLGGVLL